jgi:hypothetical protein
MHGKSTAKRSRVPPEPISPKFTLLMPQKRLPDWPILVIRLPPCESLLAFL